ncbi:MAG: hypothetical protein ACRDMX_12945 [Solirubrobacteraceae bacterium]
MRHDPGDRRRDRDTSVQLPPEEVAPLITIPAPDCTADVTGAINYVIDGGLFKTT